MYLYGTLNNFLILSTLLILSIYLFDIVSNNQNYLKNILRKSRTKKLYFGAPEFLGEEEEEEEEV